MTETTTFHCIECLDTQTIDRGGREIPCPFCQITVKLSGLNHGLGNEGRNYVTAESFTRTTITFTGTRALILADVVQVRRDAEDAARAAGRKGRNSITSGPLAIERKVREVLS